MLIFSGPTCLFLLQHLLAREVLVDVVLGKHECIDRMHREVAPSHVDGR